MHYLVEFILKFITLILVVIVIGYFFNAAMPSQWPEDSKHTAGIILFFGALFMYPSGGSKNLK